MLSSIGARDRALSIRWPVAVSSLFTVFLGLFLTLKFLISPPRGIFYDYAVNLLAINFIEFGAIRRSLPGSLVQVLGIGLDRGSIALYCAAAVAFSGTCCWILARMVPPRRSPAAALVLAGPILFWSVNIGSGSDMLVAVALACSALALSSLRLILACVCLAVGVAVHEISFICGLPLLVALSVDESRWRSFRMGSVAGGTFVIVGTLVLYACLDRLPHSDAHTIMQTIRALRPETYFGDMAIYYSLAGLRGVQTAMCTIASTHYHLIHLPVAFGMVLLGTVALAGWSPRGWVCPLMASLPPVVFLWAVAGDMSRWTAFGVVNAWLVCALRQRGEMVRVRRLPWVEVACAVVLVVLQYPNVAYSSTYYLYPSPLVQHLIEKVGGAPFYQGIDKCDPDWRSVLGERPE